MARMNASDLIGKDILCQDGRELGSVKDLMFDAESWTIGVLVVKLARDVLETLHMKRPLIGTQTMHVPVTDVSGVSDKVILTRALAEYARAKDSEKAEPS
ncbi:MAG: PRC-barrel domain-containing protein [Sandaracinaceae bacterium]|nr:PRC-barrel domain-containing protein [Sandaracinaceae bacterium]MCC6877128.1 PRC-barrel domain-containing protein [Sandaracinaceae bacterium]